MISHGRSCCELKSEINIVPFLDILLVLLLIFIATEPPITQSVRVDLPDTTESQIVRENNDPLVVIEVSGVEEYTMVVEKKRMDRLPPEKVIDKIQQRLNSNSKTVFLIGGEKNVPYNEIIKALDLLHTAGVRSVGLITRPI